MAQANLISVEKNLSKIDSAVLKLGSDLKQSISGSKELASGFSQLNIALKSSASNADKATKSLTALSAVGGGAFKVFLGVAEIAGKLKAIVDIGNAGYKAWKEFSGVANTLDFAEAITGSNQLAKNLQFLETTSNTFFGTVEKGLQIFSDQKSFNQWAADGVKAYSEVEQAAYRLSTIIVSGNDRSIDSVGKQIESMRSLQKATNNALDSVTLLNAQYDIASAGFTDKQSNLQVGKAAIGLSQAGFGNLAGSTNAVVRVQKALGEDASTAQKRAAQLFETTKVGLLTLDQLTPNIGALASQSKQLGVQFEEVAGSLAVLTTQGISADEAATRLTSFLGDVVNVSPEAARALAQFTDEAGKPIQLNAQVLKEKGIQGVIRDLKKATGGELSKIQQIFSNQTSQEFATLLIGAGDESLTSATGRLKNVDTKAFEEEGANRGKTIDGAFTQAFNKSQAEVEKFGATFKDSVLKQLESTDSVLGTFANGSAEALGGILGKINLLKTGLSAVGGFIATAFSVVAPLAFIAVIGKAFNSLGSKIKEVEAKEGKSIWKVLEQKALEAIAKIKQAIAKNVADIIKEVDRIKNKINEVGNSKVNIKIQEKKGIAEKDDVIKPKKVLDGDAGSSALDSLGGSLDLVDEKTKKVSTSAKTLEKDFDSSASKINKSVDSKITGSLKNTSKTKFSILPDINTSGIKDGLGKVGKVAGGAAKGAFNVLSGTILQTGKYLLGLGAIGAVAAGGIAVVSGWASTLFGMLDKKSIPALQDMAESLKDLKGVSGLSESLAEFDAFTGSLNKSNYLLDVYNESLANAAGLWNAVTGAALQNAQVQDEIAKRQKIIQDDKNKALEKGSTGQLDASTTSEKLVNRKIASGASLDAEDEKVVTDYYNNQIKANQALLTLQEQRIENEKKQGGFGSNERVQELSKELAVMREQIKTENERFEQQKQLTLTRDKLNDFKNIDTTTPINVQISSNSERAIRGQITTLTEDFNNAFNGDLIDPQKTADKLKSIVPQLNSVLSSLETQIELNPDSAEKLRKELESKLGTNLTKYLASDPALRQKYSAVLEAETNAKLKKATTKETTANTSLDTAQNLGLENAALSGAKFENTTKSINTQVAALTEELNKPTTSLTRQLEIQQQIEELESKRAQASADNRIKQELQGRKNVLTISQQLLSIEQAKINLFSQQNDFDTFSINAANAKLDAAQKQLQVTKEQNAIESKETEIRKEEGVKALEGKLNRDKNSLTNAAQGTSALKPGEKVPSLEKANSIIDNQVNSQISKLKETNEKEAQLADAKRKDALANVDATMGAQNATYTQDEQAKISSVLNRKVEELFSPSGNLKKDVNSVYNSLTNIQSKNIKDPAEVFGAIDIISRKNNEKTFEKERLKKDLPTGDSVRKGLESQVKSKEEERTKRKELAKEASTSIAQGEKVLSEAKKELNFTQIVNDVKARFATLNDVIEVNKAKIEAEFASREKLVKFSEAIGNATSTIGNSLKGLSNLGAGLSGVGSSLAQKGFEASNPLGSIANRRDKALKQVESTENTTKGLEKETQAALDNAIKKGADPKIIKELTAARDKAKITSARTSEEAKIDKARIKEQTALEAANVKLTIFSNRVGTFNDAIQGAIQNMNKIAETAKDSIDLGQRKNDNAAANATSQIGVQKSLLGFFGNNNPAVTALTQRLDVQQADVEGKQQKSQAVTEAKKEVIDLSLQKASLDLEGKMLENALTQTQLLADILNVNQGGEATFSTSDEVQKRIQSIPDAIKKSQGLNNAQQNLVDQKLAFIPQELNDKLTRIDADTASKKLGALGGNLQPGNFDLIGGALTDASSSIDKLSTKKQNIRVGSLRDSDVTNAISAINSEAESGLKGARDLSTTSKGEDKFRIKDSARKIDALKAQESKLDAEREKLFGKDKDAIKNDLNSAKTGLNKDGKATADKATASNISNNTNNVTTQNTFQYNITNTGNSFDPKQIEGQIKTSVTTAVNDAIKLLGTGVKNAVKNF